MDNKFVLVHFTPYGRFKYCKLLHSKTELSFKMNERHTAIAHVIEGGEETIHWCVTSGILYDDIYSIELIFKNIENVEIALIQNIFNFRFRIHIVSDIEIILGIAHNKDEIVIKRIMVSINGVFNELSR